MNSEQQDTQLFHLWLKQLDKRLLDPAHPRPIAEQLALLAWKEALATARKAYR